MLVIRGIIRLKSRQPITPACGAVRLEDVSLADLPSRTVAEHPIRLAEGRRIVAFSLPIAGEIDRSRHYIISAELCTAAVGGAPAQIFGVTAAYGWDPTRPGRSVEIELEPLN